MQSTKHAFLLQFTANQTEKITSMLIPGISRDALLHIITLTAFCANELIQSLRCRTFRDDGQLRAGAALVSKFQTNT